MRASPYLTGLINIPDTTDGKPNPFIEAIAGHTPYVVDHVPSPSVRGIVVGTTPPGAVAASIGEVAIVPSDAAWKSREIKLIKS